MSMISSSSGSGAISSSSGSAASGSESSSSYDDSTATALFRGTRCCNGRLVSAGP